MTAPAAPSRARHLGLAMTLGHAAWGLLITVATALGDGSGVAGMGWELLLVSALGAALAGLLLRRGYGRPGAGGLALALGTGLLATALGSALGGTFVLPGPGTILGPAFVFGGMVRAPGVVLIWLAGLVALHTLALWLRASEVAPHESLP